MGEYVPRFTSANAMGEYVTRFTSYNKQNIEASGVQLANFQWILHLLSSQLFFLFFFFAPKAHSELA
jgi:hypothetical protein